MTESIVISGISGLFPEANNVKAFSNLLYNKKNPISSATTRWQYEHPELSQYIGNVPEISFFDAQFFGIHYRLCSRMDAMGRKLLEQTYQAIFDAGCNPDSLNGKRVGVYVGCSMSETEKSLFYTYNLKNDFGIMGCSKTMFANRISYWLNTKGPSMAVDGEGCSSLLALEMAYRDMNRGVCEAAIVAGCNLCLHPQTQILYNRTLKICKDGKTRSYDENACGCAKSEAISVLFVQKAKDAFRIYAELISVKCSFITDYKTESGNRFQCQRQQTADFLKVFYDEANVAPNEIEYVEGVGLGIPELDKIELDVFEEVFCKDRNTPLLVGSVTSNIGYGDASHGLSAIFKVLLGFQTGQLAANLHLAKPRQDVAALRDGRMCILSENHSFRRSYVAVNGFSITGLSSHALLLGRYKQKDTNRYKCNIPYLITISGRVETSVAKIIDYLKSHPADPEELALLHNFHEKKVKGHMARGYIILDTNEAQETVVLSEKNNYYDDDKKPLCFVYSGMGSQWVQMGKKLMDIPVFASAIMKCQKILQPKGIDVVDIITSDDKTIFDNILNCFVGIAAIQIGLTDVLLDLGIVPDIIIGHSVGELGCAYADGCFTAEEMILSAFYRGKVSLESSLIKGCMAAVGLGYTEISQVTPSDIDVACHNSAESCTISGPAESVRNFVTQLTATRIFAKEVPCANIAYHSRYIADIGPALLQCLKTIIKTPKMRSQRWLSTSVPRVKWEEPLAKYSSAEYHTNNLLSPVLLEETCALIPKNAVIVEVAPHGLLQAILKRSLSTCTHVPLTRRKDPNNTALFLNAVGRLYLEGINPKVKNLYPKVEFPVSTETPNLSHLVEWSYTENWPVPLYITVDRRTAALCKFVLSVHDNDCSYLKGHVIGGKNLYPFAGALVAVWDTLAMIENKDKQKISVEFRDVYLHSQPILHDSRQLRLTVALHRISGRFEVLDDVTKVATGYIRFIKENFFYKNDNINKISSDKSLNSSDVYTHLNNRDYFYEGNFKTIHKVNVALAAAELLWCNNWVTFIDGIIQLNILKQKHESVSEPNFIRNLLIDVHHHSINSNKNESCIMKAELSSEHNRTRCGGVTMDDITFSHIFPLSLNKVVVKNMKSSLKPSIIVNNNTIDFDVSLEDVADNTVILQSKQVGDLDSFHWVQTTYAEDKQDRPGIEVKVHFAGLNGLDRMKSFGDIKTICRNEPEQIKYGMDFSGITKRGTRVMGLVNSGAVCSRVIAQQELLWPIPEYWTLEDAATIPLAYCLAFYCLVIKANNIYRGARILVHGGTGALGQAVISVALWIGCEVFTTVSNIRKKALLQRLFPELCDDHIGYSRDITFRDSVLHATSGRGCDLVITCGKGEIRNAALGCCGLKGVAIDLTQIYSHESFSYGMTHLNMDQTYTLADMSSVISKGNIRELKLLQQLVSVGIKQGYVRPLSRVTFVADDVSRAFRLLASKNHCGRILIDMQDHPTVVQPMISCSPKKSHIVVSNDEALGILVTERLIQRGVKKIMIICPGIQTQVEFKMQQWRDLGVQLKTYDENLTDDRIDVVLHECVNVEPNIEGIHVIMPNNDIISSNEKLRLLVEKLDSMSRKSHPSLRYFSILSGDNAIGEHVCISRAKRNLPATNLNIFPLLKKEGINKSRELKKVSKRDIVIAFEQAIVSQETVLSLYQNSEAKQSLIEQIAIIAGFDLEKVVNENTTLMDLVVEPKISQDVLQFFRNTCNITLSPEKVGSLSIKRIREFEKILTEANYEDTVGLHTFISYVDPDELLATTDIVYLPTRAALTSMRGDEVDSTQTYLCIVPGLEGNHARFKLLCERLKLPAFVLQSDLNGQQETIIEVAQKYTDIIIKKAGCKSNFYLLGYETGILIALEMAAILEDKGLTGTVFCIGGGPSDIKHLLEEYLSGLNSEEAIQEALTKHMITLMAQGKKKKALQTALNSNLPWREKREACIRMLLDCVSYSAQYMHSQIEAIFWRLISAINHNISMRSLRSQLIFLNPRRSSSKHISSTERLQAHSEQKVAIYQLRATIASAIYDLRCAAIINEHLSINILNAFKEKNLCDTYLVN